MHVCPHIHLSKQASSYRVKPSFYELQTSVSSPLDLACLVPLEPWLKSSIYEGGLYVYTEG